MSEVKPLRKKLLFTGLAVALFVGVFALYRVLAADPYAKRIEWTIIALEAGRYGIGVFNESEGRYPDSLSELETYAERQPEKNLRQGRLQEYISSELGSEAESATLNGKGGWFYDNTTGELRVNLTKPLRTYFKYYYHRGRNDIPSDW
jgi:hypothetical protein